MISKLLARVRVRARERKNGNRNIFVLILPKEGSGAGVGFDGPPEEDPDFFASTGSARLCFGPRAIKSPENPRGFDLEFLGGKFLPRSIITTVQH
jgi:hypothetical protein